MSDGWIWRQIAAEKAERARQERPALRRLAVPPGVYGLNAGEEKLVTDCKGNRFIVFAAESARSWRGRRREGRA